MRRVLKIAGVLLLLGVVVASLAACTQDLSKGRTTPTAVAEVTQAGVPPRTGVPTPLPGETVVSAFTPVPQTAEPGVTPTQDLTFETPAATAPAPTAGPEVTAVPPTQPSGGTTAKPIVHVVQQGETLSSIALRYGTTVQAIATANNIVDPNAITVGQRLTIPVKGGSSAPSGGCRIRYTVKAGDWIWQIARNYGVSPYDILAANGLSIASGSQIQPGQVLCIP